VNRRVIITLAAVVLFLIGGVYLWISLPEIIHRYNTNPNVGFHRVFTRPRTKRQAALEHIRVRVAVLENLEKDGVIRYPSNEDWENYMETVPRDKSNDPWGNPYRYELFKGKPRLTSAGRDQIFGTGDDISN
jgi:hypothetical protein